MGGSSGGGGSSVQQTLPPPQLAPAYQTYGNQLNQFMGQPGTAFNQYQGPTLAGTSPYTQQAISALADPASYLPSRDYYQSVMQGDYLGLNPAMQGAVMNPAIQATDARFNQLGRFGSPGNAQASQEAAMRAMMPYYDAERQRQGQAAGLLPLLQQQQAAGLQQAGAMQEGVGQRDIQEAMAQFQQQNYDPRLAQLQAYGGLLAPGSQYSMTSSQMPGGSPLAGAMGGAMMGSMIPGLLGPAGMGLMAANPAMWPFVIGGGLLGAFG